MLAIPALKGLRQDCSQFKASLGCSLDHFPASKTLLERRTAGGWEGRKPLLHTTPSRGVARKEEKGEKLMVSYRGNIPRINFFHVCSQNKAGVGDILLQVGKM